MIIYIITEIDLNEVLTVREAFMRKDTATARFEDLSESNPYPLIQLHEVELDES